jgi:biopolymer transport protein ExbB
MTMDVQGVLGLLLPLAQEAPREKTYFELLFWPGGGGIGVFLWLLSVVMVAFVVQALIQIRKPNVCPDGMRGQIQTLFDNKQYREAIDLTANQGDFLSNVIHAALTEAPRGYSAMERAMEDAAATRTVRMIRSIEWLNLLGNVGPMIGLLGTVWGMIMVFAKIAAANNVPTPAELAGPLGVKLVCTLVGLVVAIPSLSFYGIMRTRIDELSSQAVVAAQEMIAIFRPGGKPAQAQAPVQA